MQSGNRAEAWFQIRYGSNKSQTKVQAARQYYTSQVFGLFDNPTQPSAAQAVQAYQMLTTNRAVILPYELHFGTDPNGAAPLSASQQLVAANGYAGPGSSFVQTLAATLQPAEVALTQSIAAGESLLSAAQLQNFATSTNIFVATPALGPQTVDANVGYGYGAAAATEVYAQETANHIVVGEGTGEKLIGGLGSDILIAGAGNETLVAGAGADSLIAGQGSATLIGGKNGGDVFDLEFGGGQGLVETIVDQSGGADVLDVAGVRLGPASLIATGPDKWVDPTTGAQYEFLTGDQLTNPPTGFSPSAMSPSVGELVITQGPLFGSNQIDVWGFNLSQAGTDSGFDGIHIQTLTLLSGSQLQDPPTPNFVAGSTQSYTVALDAPTETAQTVTLTLSGASASDFELDTGAGLSALNSNGTFSVTIPAGESTASFSLTNTADVGSGASLQVTAALTGASSSTLTQAYVEPARDPFATATANLSFDNSSTDSAGTYNLYTNYISGGTPVAGAGAGNNVIDVRGAANESVAGGNGNDTIVAAFGYELSSGGTDVITGGGGQDILISDLLGSPNGPDGPSSVRIYGNSEVSLATAIADANIAGNATGQKGDLISSADANSTIVGGNGNDLLMAANGGSALIVSGPGNDTIVGGAPLTETEGPDTNNFDAFTTWSSSFSNDQLTLGGNFYLINYGGTETPPPPGYEGNVDDNGGILGSENDTIYGGAGKDVIILSNGNNEVTLGNGASTVLGGMGSNTITGGAGNDSILGGGGSDYIAASTGNDLIVGRGGDNTIIGGSGSDTLFAGGDGANWATAETGNNYVEAGSGNTTILGSGGNDTLIGGSGTDLIQAGNGNEVVAAGSGQTSINGGTGNDTLSAGDGSDTIFAGQGSHTTIYGGGGTDQLFGSTGTNVIYAGDGGTALAPTQIDTGTGDTTVYGGSGVDLITGGGTGTEVLYAGDGGNAQQWTQVEAGDGAVTIYGGSGIDHIRGGGGTDVLYAGDGGTQTDATYVAAGSGASTLYGGAGVSILSDTVGGGDLLIGGTGESELVGIGSDTLQAGSGDDTLVGSGSNTYVFGSDIGDDVIQSSGSATIQFTSDVSPSDVAVGGTIASDGSGEIAIFDGAGSISLNPSALDSTTVDFSGGQSMSLSAFIAQADASGADDSVVAGTNGNLIFDLSDSASVVGGTGQDTLYGLGNNDTLTAGSAGNQLYGEGSGDVLSGGSGNDTLTALGTNDTLIGGTGYETFDVSNASTVVQDATPGNSEIDSSVSFTLPTNIDTLNLTGSASLTATGNSDVVNTITGNSGSDTLIAGSGNDTLISGSGVDELVGGVGPDTFAVNNSSDSINPVGNGYQDTVQSSVSYNLEAAVGTLQLTGSADLSARDSYGYATLTGNAGNDTLTAGNGVDTLIAGTGVDSMIGGGGRTTFVVNNTADVVAPGLAGTYTVDSSVDWTLGAGIDSLTLTGFGNLLGQGNGDSSNYIVGNSGNDTLKAGSGADTLVSGSGTDTLIAGSGSDVLEGSAGDTYVLNSGFGNTEIATPSGGTLEFGSGISASNLTLGLTTGSDGNVALRIQDGSGSATVDDAFGGGLSAVAFSNGSPETLAQLLATAPVTASTLSFANGNAILDTTAGDTFSGDLGNDTLIGTAAGQTLEAGTGNQLLFGAGANDILMGSTGSDTLVGGVGDDNFIASTGYTLMEAGAGNSSYVISQGATAEINAGGATGTQLIVLPAGASLSDFTAYQGGPSGQDLVLVSSDGTTQITIDNYYAGDSGKTWMLAGQGAGGQTVETLSHFLASQAQTASGYQAEINSLLSAFEAKLPGELKLVGLEGGSITNPTLDGQASPSYPPYFIDTYKFNGVQTQNLTVQNGVLDISAPTGSEVLDVQTQFTQTTTEVPESVPVYTTETSPGGTYFIPNDGSSSLVGVPNDGSPALETPAYDSSGHLTGVDITVPAVTEQVQTGTRTVYVSVPAQSTHETQTQSFIDYNITGDGGNDVISANGPFVGTIKTGNGNVSVNLDANGGGVPYFFAGAGGGLGAFIETGSGVDTVFGTMGDSSGNGAAPDTIAAGLGFDYLEGGPGSTYYVPMQGDSTDIIQVPSVDYGGTNDGNPNNRSSPMETIVLPTGVSPQDIQYRFVPATTVGGQNSIELLFGDSSVVVNYSAPLISLNGGGSSDPTALPAPILFKFADGTVLTGDQVLAMATPESGSFFNPTPQVQDQSVGAHETVSAASFFAATDNPGNPITWFQVSNSGTGYFTLNGVVQTTNSFYVSSDQLSQVAYVAGTAGSTNTVSVSAFDGVAWSTASSFNINNVVSSVFVADGPDEVVTGPAAGPDTLIGGYGGDTLIGASGQDTFVYNAGSGPETISETATPSSSNSDTVQFGSGITDSSIALSLASDGQLVLTIGTAGDSVSLSGFDPTNPLGSLDIQGFSFANGTTLDLSQLLTDANVTGGTGTVTNSDGSTTTYSFTPSGTTVYTAETTNAQGHVQESATLDADGSLQTISYEYNVDGSYSDTQVQTDASGNTTTTVLRYNSHGQLFEDYVTNPDGSTTDSFYNSQGQVIQENVTNPDGSGVDYFYNAQGQLTEKNVTNADGSSTDLIYNGQGQVVADYITNADGSSNDLFYNDQGQLVEDYVANVDGSSSDLFYNGQGQLTEDVVTNADGSIADYTYSTQGQLLTADLTAVDGSTNNSTYAYNADGSYTDTVVQTDTSGNVTTTVLGYNAQSQLVSDDVTNPDGSTANYSYNTQGQLIEADLTAADGSTSDSTYAFSSNGSYTDTVVQTDTSGHTTTTVLGYNAQNQLLSDAVTNPDGSMADYTYNTQGQLLTADLTAANGATNDSTYAYHADGSYSNTVVQTDTSGNTTTTVLSYNAQNQLLSDDITNGNVSQADYTYNTAGQLLTADLTLADGSTSDSTYAYHADGSYTDTVVQTPASGGATTTALAYDAQGHLLSDDVTNPDGSTADYTYSSQGLLATADLTSANGSSSDSTYAYHADGSYTNTVVQTDNSGNVTTTVLGYSAQNQLLSDDVTNPDGSSADYTYSAQGQLLTADLTASNGATTDSTYAYNADGSFTDTVVQTSAGGGSTTTVLGYSAQSQLLSDDVTNPDGSTADYTYSTQGQLLTADVTAADGSTTDSTYAYNADGSYSDTVVQTPVGGSATTTVFDYGAAGQLLNENVYTPSADGSYSDSWLSADGSHGTYSWNAATGEYQDSWYNADGSSFTDEYQYAAGGSPGSSGSSFTETYSSSDGSSGTRTYDASGGVTSLTWNSASTGSISGTTTDSGFYGLQNQGELTNTQPDLTFFNPNISPQFHTFLAGH